MNRNIKIIFVHKPYYNIQNDNLNYFKLFKLTTYSTIKSL